MGGDVKKYTRSYDEAMALLKKGEKVLFNPDWRTLQGIEGKFVPVFWSPVHFPNQAGTMGVLCNPAHPALSEFPTEYYSDYQWWDAMSHSGAIEVAGLTRTCSRLYGLSTTGLRTVRWLCCLKRRWVRASCLYQESISGRIWTSVRKPVSYSTA